MLSTITIGNIKQEIACMPSAASQLRLFALLHYLWPLNKGPAAPKTPKAFIFPKGVGKMKNGCPDFRAPAGGCLRPFPRKYIGVIYNKPNLTFFHKGVGKIENGCPDFREPLMRKGAVCGLFPENILVQKFTYFYLITFEFSCFFKNPLLPPCIFLKTCFFSCFTK